MTDGCSDNSDLLKAVKAKVKPYLDMCFEGSSKRFLEGVRLSSDDGKRLLKRLHRVLGLNFPARFTLSREESGMTCKSVYPVYVEVEPLSGNVRAVRVEHRVEYASQTRVSQAFETLAFSKLLELGYPGARLKGQDDVGAAFGWIAVFTGPPYFNRRSEPGTPVYPVIEVDESNRYLVNKYWSAYRLVSGFYVNAILLTATVDDPEVHEAWSLLHGLKILTLLYPEEWNPNRPELTPTLAVEEKLRQTGRGQTAMPNEVLETVKPLLDEGVKPMLQYASPWMSESVKALFEALCELPYQESIFTEGFPEQWSEKVYLTYLKACESLTGLTPKARLMEDYVVFEGEAWLKGEPELTFAQEEAEGKRCDPTP